MTSTISCCYTLVYRIYGGLDLILLLWRIRFYVRVIETEIPEHAISWQNVILCIKSNVFS